MMHRFGPAILALTLFCASLTAQTYLGTLNGRVLDPTGAVVANAKVAATNTETNVAYRTTTNEAGNYLLLQLPLGKYEVAIEAAGFRRYVRTDIVLNVAQTISLTDTLAVGTVEQTVEVTGTTGLLETSTSDLGTTIQRNKLMDLPLFVGGAMRNLEQFIFLAPGVTGDSVNTQIAGSPNRAKEVLVDGIASTGIESGGVIPGSARPSVETIGEFKLIRANFNAEYGRTGGGVQIFTTRSGTNELHGAVFDYLRNDKLDARGFFQGRRPVNRQNEFGASLGGPVWLPGLYNGKNRTFFYFVYSGFRFRQGAANALLNVLPNDYRQGNFTRLGQAIYDPATTTSTASGFTRTPFAGNLIPTSRFSAVSRNIVPLLPTPSSDTLFNNFVSQGRGSTGANQANVKIDHQFNELNRISGYFYIDRFTQREPEGVPGPTTQRRATTSRNVWGRLTHDYVINATTLHHINLGYTRFLTGIESYSLGQDWPNKLGLTGVNTGPDSSFPRVQFLAAGYDLLGDFNGNSTVKQANNAFQLNESLSLVRGNHNYKVGIDYRWTETNGIDNWQANGLFDFNALQTGLPGNARTGSAVASFLLGAVDRGAARVYAYFPRNRYQYLAAYAQDDWKATRKLTVNYGIRYDVFFPRGEKLNNLSTFDPNTPNPAAGNRLGALIFLGDGPGRSGLKSFADTDYKAFGPRLGLAYQIDSKTVVRTGYGIYYALGNANAGLRDSLNSSNGFIAAPVFQSLDAGVTAAFNWDRGFPQNFVQPPVISPSAANGSEIRLIAKGDGRAPYFQNWTMTIEREIVNRVNFEVGYLGTKGSRLGTALVRSNELSPDLLRLGSLLTRPFNSAEAIAAGIASPYPGFTGSVAQALRPYPQYNNLLNRADPSGSSTYHSLQTQLTVRAAKGFDVLASYTWAKTISDSDVLAGGGQGGQTTFNRGLEKAIAITDIPHVFNLSYSYQLPFGPGQAFLRDGGVMGKVVGGWVFTGIHQYASGVPIILTANNSLPLFNALLRPNVVAGATLAGKQENFDPAVDRWINPAAFSVPGALTFGTSARSHTSLRNPAGRNENFGLLKKIPLWERATLTFRAEMFNAFNRVVFAAPQANISNSAFGRISAQANTPRQGQMALRLDF
ncbi:MAG: TonB-dependent receptor [Acidobacteria bacterium]|nr:TonB-dependent receptor [Acidobacteriota bacterium]